MASGDPDKVGDEPSVRETLEHQVVRFLDIKDVSMTAAVTSTLVVRYPVKTKTHSTERIKPPTNLQICKEQMTRHSMTFAANNFYKNMYADKVKYKLKGN